MPLIRARNRMDAVQCKSTFDCLIFPHPEHHPVRWPAWFHVITAVDAHMEWTLGTFMAQCSSQQTILCTPYYVQDLDTRSPCLFRAGETRLCRQQEAKGIRMCVYNTGRLLAWVQLDCLAAEEGACLVWS